LKTKTKTETKK